MQMAVSICYLSWRDLFLSLFICLQRGVKIIVVQKRLSGVVGRVEGLKMSVRKRKQNNQHTNLVFKNDFVDIIRR